MVRRPNHIPNNYGGSPTAGSGSGASTVDGSQNELITNIKAVTDHLTSLNPGQVTFGNSDGSLTQSVSLVWDNVNKYLGIGTSIPQVQLEFNLTGQTPPTPTATGGIRLVSSAANFSGCAIEGIGTNGSFLSRRTNGTFASPTALANNDIVFRFLARGYDGSTYPGNSGTFGFRASEAWSVSTHAMHFEIQGTPVGSTSVQNTMTVMGNAHVSFGPSAPVASAALDLQVTDGALIVPRLTTTQKSALTAINGMIIYDTTLNKFQGYENGAWTSFI